MKRVLITGANRGLGLEFTRYALGRGDQVFAGLRNPNKATALQELQALYPGQLQLLRIDVASRASIEASARELRTNLSGLDLLINNAGINSRSADAGEFDKHVKLGRLEPEAMIDMFRVNSLGPLLVAQQYLDLLKAGDEPKVVSISSWLGSLSDKQSGGNYSYCASKTTLNMLMRAFAFDVLEHGIISVLLNPGWVQTDMGGNRAKLTPSESVAGMFKLIDNLTEEHAGRFFDWDGKEHPW